MSENPRKLLVSEILKLTSLASATITWSKSMRSHLFPIMECPVKNVSVSECICLNKPIINIC